MLFQYKAASPQGQIIKGVIDAQTPKDLTLRLKEEGLDLITCKITKSTPKSSFFNPITPQHLIEMCIHLEHMERAGVPLMDSLKELRLAHASLRSTLQCLIDDIEGGLLFSQALDKHPHIFDRVFVGLVAVGESTGHMAESLEAIATHLAWIKETHEKITQALRYPLIMAGVLMIAFVILLVVMVPELVSFLQNLGQELPWMTLVLYDVSLFLQEHGIVTGVGVAAFGGACYFLAQNSEKLRAFFKMILLKIPLVGAIYKNIELARFSHYLAVMCQNSVNLLDALGAVVKATRDPSMKRAFGSVALKIKEGKTLSKALASTNLFPSLIIRMVMIGEDTGKLPETLAHVKDHFDRTIQRQIAIITAWIEPLLITFAGAFLILIVYSIFWPLYDSLSIVDL